MLGAMFRRRFSLSARTDVLSTTEQLPGPKTAARIHRSLIETLSRSPKDHTHSLSLTEQVQFFLAKRSFGPRDKEERSSRFDDHHQ